MQGMGRAGVGVEGRTPSWQEGGSRQGESVSHVAGGRWDAGGVGAPESNQHPRGSRSPAEPRPTVPPWPPTACFMHSARRAERQPRPYLMLGTSSSTTKSVRRKWCLATRKRFITDSRTWGQRRFCKVLIGCTRPFTAGPRQAWATGDPATPLHPGAPCFPLQHDSPCSPVFPPVPQRQKDSGEALTRDSNPCTQEVRGHGASS